MSKKQLAVLILVFVSLLWATASVTAKILVWDVDPLGMETCHHLLSHLV